VSAALAEEATAVAAIRAWRDDPVLFVRQVFKAEPDVWQADVLRSLLTDKRIAMSACKGPGKSTTQAWCGWWILTCHIDAQGIACSITADNLRDGLWKELAVWHAKSELLQAAFTINAERIASRERPKTWWLSARSFAQQADASQQANTLAGLHAKTVFVLLDEVGDYPTGVLPAAEGIFANKGDAWLIVGGNPTTVGGPLHRICTTDAKSWKVVYVTGDPDDHKRSPRIDLQWAKDEIAKNGRDNPWVMVNILGLFPPTGSDQLVSVNLVIQAMARDLPALSYQTDARVWGLDPSRFGDDEAVLARRQGVLARRMLAWRNLDGTRLGDAVAALILDAEKEKEPPDCVFVDVGGVGSSCYDRLVHLGYDDIVQPVDFGGGANDPRYLNKRVEMWSLMADWLKGMPACLPNDPTLQGELTGPRYWFRVVNKRTAFVLESKDEMKKRGVPSPNRADALALTFAAPVAPKSRQSREQGARPAHALTDYDPFVVKEAVHGQ
jgi:hypothetical protein